MMGVWKSATADVDSVIVVYNAAMRVDKDEVAVIDFKVVSGVVEFAALVRGSLGGLIHFQQSMVVDCPWPIMKITEIWKTADYDRFHAHCYRLYAPGFFEMSQYR